MIFGPPMPKNAKNHAISLLQMQGCPQSNAKQEIKNIVSKIAKRIFKFVKKIVIRPNKSPQNHI
jgi:hypothetical protein